MIMLDAATLLIFPALMIFAAFSDLLTMTISNRLSIALAVLFIPMALAGGFTTAEICWHLARGISMLILGFGCSRRAGSAVATRNSQRRPQFGLGSTISANIRLPQAPLAVC